MAYRFADACALGCIHQFNHQEIDMTTQPGIEPDRIDVNDQAACEQWAKKLDTTKMQLHDAVAAVGGASRAIKSIAASQSAKSS